MPTLRMKTTTIKKQKKTTFKTMILRDNKTMMRMTTTKNARKMVMNVTLISLNNPLSSNEETNKSITAQMMRRKMTKVASARLLK